MNLAPHRATNILLHFAVIHNLKVCHLQVHKVLMHANIMMVHRLEQLPALERSTWAILTSRSKTPSLTLSTSRNQHSNKKLTLAEEHGSTAMIS